MTNATTSSVEFIQAYTGIALASNRWKQVIRWLHLEIVGQFRSSGIARVHCDGHKTIRVQFQFGAFEHEPREVGGDGALDAQDLWETTKRLAEVSQHFKNNVEQR